MKSTKLNVYFLLFNFNIDINYLSKETLKENSNISMIHLYFLRDCSARICAYMYVCIYYFVITLVGD